VIAVSPLGKVRGLERISHMREVADYVEEMLSEAYKRVVAAEELLYRAKVVDRERPHAPHAWITQNDALDETTKERGTALAREVATLSAPDIASAARAAAAFADALNEREQELEGGLHAGGGEHA
jgi:hypothetical protein